MSISRRKFLGVLAALPFVGGAVAKALAAPVPVQTPDALTLDELLRAAYQVKRNREASGDATIWVWHGTDEEFEIFRRSLRNP